jgi:hypothetical protein
MPGEQGGFNNDDINGKSRNPYSTTSGTGPRTPIPRPAEIRPGSAQPHATS